MTTPVQPHKKMLLLLLLLLSRVVVVVANVGIIIIVIIVKHTTGDVKQIKESPLLFPITTASILMHFITPVVVHVCTFFRLHVKINTKLSRAPPPPYYYYYHHHNINTNTAAQSLDRTIPAGMQDNWPKRRSTPCRMFPWGSCSC